MENDGQMFSFNVDQPLEDVSYAETLSKTPIKYRELEEIYSLLRDRIYSLETQKVSEKIKPICFYPKRRTICMENLRKWWRNIDPTQGFSTFCVTTPRFLDHYQNLASHVP